MNTPKHTPGPWRQDGVEIVHDIAESGLPHSVIRSDGERWAALVEITDDEGEANASLIASAPELFEALEACRCWLEYLHQKNVYHTKIGAALDLARAAIAKAEGRE